MGKYIGAAVVLVALIGFAILGGRYLLNKSSGGVTPIIPNTTTEVPVQVATSTYASSTLGFSVVYPKSYTVNDTYAYDQFGPKKLIHGVKFVIPSTMATGTNLSSNDTGVSIEQLPHAKKCTADIYMLQNVKAHTESFNGVEYSVASSSDAGAGNRYEETVHAFTSSIPCTALRYFIHYGDINNYDASSSIKEFDRAALLKDFDVIRSSVVFTH